jgi:putative phage-type endonuclease
MAITEIQRAKRQSHIGGSDVAAILGCDPFRNAYETWLEKTGKLNDEDKKTPAIRIGRILEASAMLFAQEKLGRILRNQYRVFKDWKTLACNTDGIVKESGNPVEAKTTNITYRSPEKDEWGEEGSDVVPERVILQATVQCAACESDVCHVPAIIGGRGFVMFQVTFDKALFEMIMEQLQRFWDYNVQQDIPPENVVPSMEYVKRIQRLPESIVDVDSDMVQKWQEARQNRLDCEKQEEQAQAAMLAAIGQSEAGRYDGGMVTYYQQKREMIDTTMLKEEMPEVAAKYIKETVYRVARIKKTKLLPKG